MPFVSVSCELNPVRVRYRFSDKAGGFDLELASEQSSSSTDQAFVVGCKVKLAQDYASRSDASTGAWSCIFSELRPRRCCNLRFINKVIALQRIILKICFDFFAAVCTQANGGKSQTQNVTVPKVHSWERYPCKPNPRFHSYTARKLLWSNNFSLIHLWMVIVSRHLLLFRYCVDDERDEGARCLHRMGGSNPIIRANHWSCIPPLSSLL